MLKLKNAEKAKIYGLPTQDLEEQDALNLLMQRPNGEMDEHYRAWAQAHLDSAIEADAFERDDNLKSTIEDQSSKES